jgi:hypothetical protein
MITVTITNKKDSRIGWQATFATQELADAWIAKVSQEAQLGQPERWVSEEQADIEEALDTREVDLDANPARDLLARTETQYLMPAEFIVEQEDITAKFAQDQARAEARGYLNSTDWYIIREMDSGEPCPAEVKTLRAAARAAIQ